MGSTWENQIRSSRSRDKNIKTWIRRTPQHKRRPLARGLPRSHRLRGAQNSCKGWDICLEVFGGRESPNVTSQFTPKGLRLQFFPGLWQQHCHHVAILRLQS